MLFYRVQSITSFVISIESLSFRCHNEQRTMQLSPSLLKNREYKKWKENTMSGLPYPYNDNSNHVYQWPDEDTNRPPYPSHQDAASGYLTQPQPYPPPAQESYPTIGTQYPIPYPSVAPGQFNFYPQIPSNSHQPYPPAPDPISQNFYPLPTSVPGVPGFQGLLFRKYFKEINKNFLII